MLKVALHIFDSRKFTVSEIVDLLQLSNEEIKPFEKFTNEEVRKEKIVSYFYKKVFAPDYQINENGKPISNNLFFNISHSKGLVVFVSNNKFDIGVDVASRSVSSNSCSSDSQPCAVHDTRLIKQISQNNDCVFISIPPLTE